MKNYTYILISFFYLTISTQIYAKPKCEKGTNLVEYKSPFKETTEYWCQKNINGTFIKLPVIGDKKHTMKKTEKSISPPNYTYHSGGQINCIHQKQSAKAYCYRPSDLLNSEWHKEHSNRVYYFFDFDQFSEITFPEKIHYSYLVRNLPVTTLCGINNSSLKIYCYTPSLRKAYEHIENDPVNGMQNALKLWLYERDLTRYRPYINGDFLVFSIDYKEKFDIVTFDRVDSVFFEIIKNESVYSQEVFTNLGHSLHKSSRTRAGYADEKKVHLDNGKIAFCHDIYLRSTLCREEKTNLFSFSTGQENIDCGIEKNVCYLNKKLKLLIKNKNTGKLENIDILAGKKITDFSYSGKRLVSIIIIQNGTIQHVDLKYEKEGSDKIIEFSLRNISKGIYEYEKILFHQWYQVCAFPKGSTQLHCYSSENFTNPKNEVELSIIN